MQEGATRHHKRTSATDRPSELPVRAFGLSGPYYAWFEASRNESSWQTPMRFSAASDEQGQPSSRLCVCRMCVDFSLPSKLRANAAMTMSVQRVCRFLFAVQDSCSCHRRCVCRLSVDFSLPSEIPAHVVVACAPAECAGIFLCLPRFLLTPSSLYLQLARGFPLAFQDSCSCRCCGGSAECATFALPSKIRSHAVIALRAQNVGDFLLAFQDSCPRRRRCACAVGALVSSMITKTQIQTLMVAGFRGCVNISFNPRLDLTRL